jgi:cation transport ATPase
MVPGESMPVEKHAAIKLIGGHDQRQWFIRYDKPNESGGDTILAQIVRMSAKSTKRAPIQTIG